MRLDADQLEWIVSEVVRRLRGEPAQTAAPPGNGSDDASARRTDAHIVLTNTLITTATLEGFLESAHRLSVPARAVVTPAARDLLNEHGVELLRKD